MATRIRPAVPGREASCMIEVDGRQYCIDPMGPVASALGRKWTLPLIGLLGNRPAHRFRDLQEGLTGIGSKALADRLRELRALELVTREVYAEVPARVEYRLSPKGHDLRRALVPLLDWASAHEAAAVGIDPTD